MTKQISIKTPLLIFLALLLVGLGSAMVNRHYSGIDNKETIYNVKLIDSYATTRNCGHKGRYDCEIFKGRFIIVDEGVRQGWTIDKEIDGFMHYAFQKNGASPFPTQLSLTSKYMQLSDHGVIDFISFMLAALCFSFVLLFPLFYALFQDW